MVRFISTGSWVLVDWVVGLLVSLPLYRLSGGQFPAQIETWGQLGAVMLVLLTVNTVWYSLSVARATWEQDEADVRAVPTLRIFAQSLFGIFLPLPGSVLILFALQQYHDKGLLALLVWTAASLPLHAAVKALLNAYSAHLALQQELAQQRQAVMLASRTSMIVHEVSHELGTLNLLVHLAEAAARQSGPAATAALTSLHDIRQVVQQLEQTIEHFRIAVRTQRVQYQPVRVGDLVHATLEALRSEPTTPPIHYEGKAEDMMLAGDAVLLKHALLNVLRNACEASPAGAPIELAVERDSIGKCVNITVSDQGKGIAAADLEEVCSPFFTTKAKGLGLGLALVREIVEAHGGSLGIAAQLHRGTKVTLTLPLPPVPTHLPD
jgi:signal transduction histidine kinase